MVRDINIRKVNGGFIIKIGCQEFVSVNPQEIVEGLKDYFEDPKKAEKKYVEDRDGAPEAREDDIGDEDDIGETPAPRSL